MNQEAVVKGCLEQIEGPDVFSVQSQFLSRCKKFNKSAAGTALYPATAPVLIRCHNCSTKWFGQQRFLGSKIWEAIFCEK